jgi:hypothetical protein
MYLGVDTGRREKMRKSKYFMPAYWVGVIVHVVLAIYFFTNYGKILAIAEAIAALVLVYFGIAKPKIVVDGPVMVLHKAVYVTWMGTVAVSPILDTLVLEAGFVGDAELVFRSLVVGSAIGNAVAGVIFGLDPKSMRTGSIPNE